MGNGGELIRSVDNGTTWTKPDTWGKREDGTNITLLGVAGQIDNISGNNDFQIITNSSSGKTGISSDNGSTWGVGQQFAAKDIVYGDDLYVRSEWFVAVGANGGIRKLKIMELSGRLQIVLQMICMVSHLVMAQLSLQLQD